MLNDRQYVIIDLLNKSRTALSVDEISKIVGKSKRTVLRDLSSIKMYVEESGIGALISGIDSGGYQIIVENKEAYEDMMKKNISDEELILMKLIEEPYVTLDTLSDYLYISKITVSEKINAMKENMNFIDIEVSNKGHSLHASHVKKVFLVSNLIDSNLRHYLDKIGIELDAYELLSSFIDHSEEIQAYFPNVLPDQIATLFVAALYVESESTDELEVFEQVYQSQGIPYSKNTIHTLIEVSDYCVDLNLNLSIEQIKMVLEIIEKENRIEIRNNQLATQLYHHIKRILSYPSYIQTQEIHNIKNIKARYPFSFDLSIMFINYMDRLHGYEIPNHDLIGLYFTVGMEEMKKSIHEIVIYSNLNSISNINRQLLEASISNCNVKIVDKLDDICLDNISLLINSTGNPLDINIDTFDTQYILSEKEVREIKERLEHISIRKHLQSVFIEEYSKEWVVEEGQTWEDVIEDICNSLVGKRAIEIDEANRMIERELSGNPLVVENYVIPHCISKKENFCMCIYFHLSKQLVVDGVSINHVLVTLMSTTMHNNINIFQFLYRYLNEYGTELRGVSSYEEFVQFI